MAKILLVDDDEHLIANIALSLELDNHVVDKVFDGAGAVDLLRFYSYDLVVLDLGLPDRSGLDVLSELRSNRNDTPVIILTGQNALKDKECCLDRGADDYVTKPVDIRELKARIRAILRRMAGSLSPLLVSGDLVFDPASADSREVPVRSSV